MIQKNLNSPPPLNKLAALLLLAVLAVPVQAQLVIPATTGTEACTQGGLTQKNPAAFSFDGLPTQNSVSISTPNIPLATVRALLGLSTGQLFTVWLDLVEDGSVLTSKRQGVGSTTLTNPTISAKTSNITGLKKNTRYVSVLHVRSALRENSVLARLCFKTRGEFTNAEQNLYFDGFEWQPNLARYNRTGCYAVASTRQDIRDCYCNGTRNGTHILAGQTVASQAQRQYLNCPDLDS